FGAPGAPPGPAPGPFAAPIPGPFAAPAPSPGMTAKVPPQRTMLGVAMPGIAPLSPGAPDRAPPPAWGAQQPFVPASPTQIAAAQGALPPASAPLPLVTPGGSRSSRSTGERSSRSRSRNIRPGLFALFGGLAFATAAAGFALLWHSPQPLSAAAT